MNRIETKRGKSTLDSSLTLSAMEDKLQLDRVEMLEAGKPWKLKHDSLLKRDRSLKTVTERLKNKEININQFIERVVDIMGNY